MTLVTPVGDAGQYDFKTGTLAHIAFYPDASAVLLHYVFCDEQPQSGALGLARFGTVYLCEFFKDHALCGWRNARPIVMDS